MQQFAGLLARGGTHYALRRCAATRRRRDSARELTAAVQSLSPWVWPVPHAGTFIDRSVLELLPQPPQLLQLALRSHTSGSEAAAQESFACAGEAQQCWSAQPSQPAPRARPAAAPAAAGWPRPGPPRSNHVYGRPAPPPAAAWTPAAPRAARRSTRPSQHAGSAGRAAGRRQFAKIAEARVPACGPQTLAGRRARRLCWDTSSVESSQAHAMGAQRCSHGPCMGVRAQEVAAAANFDVPAAANFPRGRCSDDGA